MLTISKPLSASQVRTYHEREFASERQNYWSHNQQGHSEWQGKLAEQWGLSGPVGNEHFARLTEGQHPATEAQPRSPSIVEDIATQIIGSGSDYASTSSDKAPTSPLTNPKVRSSGIRPRD